jgi:hypothetical protein
VKTLLGFHEQAEFLRESSGSNIEKTLRKALRVLKLFEIPHLVGGGFAAQDHGYPRFNGGRRHYCARRRNGSREIVPQRLSGEHRAVRRP